MLQHLVMEVPMPKPVPGQVRRFTPKLQPKEPQQLIVAQPLITERAMASPQLLPTPELQQPTTIIATSMQQLISYQHSMHRFQ